MQLIEHSDSPRYIRLHERDNVVIVVNDPGFQRDWATTGLWPYDAAGETRYLSVSVQGPDNDAMQYAHGLSHQLLLEDLGIDRYLTYIVPKIITPGIAGAPPDWTIGDAPAARARKSVGHATQLAVRNWTRLVGNTKASAVNRSSTRLAWK